jgi:hypothetical protein
VGGTCSAHGGGGWEARKEETTGKTKAKVRG